MRKFFSLCSKLPSILDESVLTLFGTSVATATKAISLCSKLPSILDESNLALLEASVDSRRKLY
jgi:CRISPR/Cas system CMR-associated protein Cmr5 small subunit